MRTRANKRGRSNIEREVNAAVPCSPPSDLRHLWGPAVDQILADEPVATGSPSDVRWPLADW